MGNAANYIPAFKMGHRLYPQNMVVAPPTQGNYYFVDGDKSSGGAGKTWEDAFATIQAAVTAASVHDVIFIKAKTLATGGTATDYCNCAKSERCNII